MKRLSTDAATAAARLQAGLAAALQDPSQGREDLRAAVLACARAGDAPGQLVAASALLLFTGIANDHYAGFEDAVALARSLAQERAAVADAGHRLLADAGLLVAGWFHAVDDPGLPALAQAVVDRLADDTIDASQRCAAALAALGYHQVCHALEQVLFIELAMRPLLAHAGVSARLADEAWQMTVQVLYECNASEQAHALRHRRSAERAPQPAIVLKLALLDAQMALGAARVDAGRAALLAAEPLLDPRAPRHASWWHMLRSRLDLLEGRHRQALTHARLGVRLATECQLPERWAGVMVMQEGHVQLALGQHLAAVPFFERAGRAASGSQAQYCWCVAHLARALHAFGQQDSAVGVAELAAGLAIARELAWLQFLRAGPALAAQVCALALEHGIEEGFVHEVIASRGLQAVRPDLQQWPWPIRVRTLGGLRIEIGGQALAFKGKVAKKPLELLLFVIASSGSDVSLATAAFALWRDLEGDKARAALNVALHRLRKLLGSDEALLLEHGRLSLNPRLVWVDALAFEHLADSVGTPSPEALTATPRGAAERALALYRGAFLHEGDDEAWQMAYRSRLASKFRRVLTLLAQAAVARGDGAAARALLERGLEFDPLAEDLARALMRELIAAGEQAAALAVFERCRVAIEQALGAQPAPATLALIRPLLPPT